MPVILAKRSFSASRICRKASGAVRWNHVREIRVTVVLGAETIRTNRYRNSIEKRPRLSPRNPKTARSGDRSAYLLQATMAGLVSTERTTVDKTIREQANKRQVKKSIFLSTKFSLLFSLATIHNIRKQVLYLIFNVHSSKISRGRVGCSRGTN